MAAVRSRLQNGFTVFETVVVVGILAALAAAVVPRILDSFAYGTDATDEDAFEVAHLLETGRQYAIANRANDNWGVRVVDNGTTDCKSSSAVDCVVLYKGTSFANRTSDYDTVVTLRSNNYFGSYDVSDFYFNRFSGYAMSTYAIPAWPQARYTLERSTTTDVSGNGNHGVDSGTMTDVGLCSRASDCMQGNDSYIDIPNTLLGSQNTTGLTYAMMIEAESVATDYALIGGAPNDTYDYFASGGLWLDNGVPKMSCYDGAAYQHAVSSVTLAAYQYYHIAGTYDPSDDSLKVYVDGDLAGSTTCTSITEGMTESYIGQNAKSTNRMKFTGVQADDIVVYNRPLSASEIRALAVYARNTTTEPFFTTRIYISNGSATSSVEILPNGMTRAVYSVY